MKRVWMSDIPIPGTTIALPDEEHHHLSRVRRIDSGEILEMVDGKGWFARGSVISVSKKQTLIQVTERYQESRESPLDLQLFLAMPHQKSTLDSLIPGLVQLGVNTIHLLETRYSGRLKEKGHKTFERLESIARQSLKQCGRLHLPHLVPQVPFKSSLNVLSTMKRVLVFHPYPGEATAAPLDYTDQLALVIGPEGGFDEEEFRQLLALGCLPISLGPRILKMETCVVGACFWAQARFGDFSGLETQRKNT